MHCLWIKISTVMSLVRQHSTHKVVEHCLHPKMSPEASAIMFQNKSEAWLRWVVREDQSEKREKFVLGPLQGRSVTNWDEGDEWGHSLGLMKEFLLSLEWGWAHLHRIGGHKPVTSKIAQEALWDSHPSNKLRCTWLPGASISAWQLLRVFMCAERTLCEISFYGNFSSWNKMTYLFQMLSSMERFRVFTWKWRGCEILVAWFHVTGILLMRHELHPAQTSPQSPHLMLPSDSLSASFHLRSHGRGATFLQTLPRCNRPVCLQLGYFVFFFFFWKALGFICCGDVSCIIQLCFKTDPTMGNGSAAFLNTSGDWTLGSWVPSRICFIGFYVCDLV